MLTEAQFKILKTVYLCSEQTLTQRALAAQTDMSLGKVNQTVSALTEAGLLAGGRVTDAGEEALAPYRVKNAVIMAAGASPRSRMKSRRHCCASRVSCSSSGRSASCRRPGSATSRSSSAI